MYKNNYADLKIIDVGIFLFYFMKITFTVHFLFKWRQNLSARPRTWRNVMRARDGTVANVNGTAATK